MQKYDFDNFLNSVKHFERQDVILTAKRRQVELAKVKSGINRKEALLLAEKIKKFLSEFEKNSRE